MNTLARLPIAAAVAAATSLLAIAPAQAQLKIPDLAQVGNSPGAPQAVVVQPRQFRFVVGLGFTGGGDRLATAEYYYGRDSNVRAGQLFQIHGGLDWRVAPRVTMQAVIGYHGDGVDAYNGSVSFNRYPLELLAHYAVVPGLRIGGGLRYVINPRLSGDGAARGIEADYKNTFGPVFEIEFFPVHFLGLKLRGAFEQYKPNDGTPSKSGNHVGFFTTFYF